MKKVMINTIRHTNRQRYYMTTAILIVLLFVGFAMPVSAEEVIWDYTAYEFTDTSGYYEKSSTTSSATMKCDQLWMVDISLYQNLNYIVVTIPSTSVGYSDSGSLLDSGRHEFTYSLKNQNTKPLVVYIERFAASTRITMFFDDWDIESLSGLQIVDINGMYFMNVRGSGLGSSSLTSRPIMITTYYATDSYFSPSTAVRVDWTSGVEWKNHIKLIELDPNPLGGYEFSLIRNIDGKYSQSTCKVYNEEETIFTDSSTTDIMDRWYSLGSITQINIESPTGRVYKFPVIGGADPGDPDARVPDRTGTVTMTDNNGTTISGFEVTAVNAYTGEEYTVATETDVAVMTLPMDRTIEIRNPQTGVYEESPVGYYRFYGQSPGYKMLYEDGIQVSVMPQKYTSYELCNIGVTPESGPLTGKHLFQIRSRSDNSVLQTGTVSAKSATTGEWFNTTVSGGIATLILPYDTSNTISQYAGNYYVYATSPGYEDSDYGTQIVVMPHTVSEIRDIHLTPIGGIPTPGNVTLRIQAFSETGPGVVNAEIFISGVLGEGSSVWDTYTASSTGYLMISVPGNSTYNIVASGAGYYDSAQRIEVLTTDPPLIEIKLYLSGTPTVEPTTQPTGWSTEPPTTKPTGGIPDDDDDSEGFLMQAVRGIGLAFGVGFATAKLIFGMLLALSIGYATAKQLRGGAEEFGLGLLGGTLLGVLIGLLPVWIIVVLLLVVGLYIGNRYVGGNNG